MKAVLVHTQGIRLLSAEINHRDSDKILTSCSEGHGLFIAGGVDAVLSFGNNDESQLGRGLDNDEATETGFVDGVRDVVAIAAGDKHSVSVNASGEVFSWGGSSVVRGRFGPSGRAMRITRGLEDPSLCITNVSCGAEHTIILDRTGRLFGWGEASDGQLGLASKQPITRPSELRLPGQVAAIMVACGAKHSLVVSSDLRVFASGVAPATGLDVDCDVFRPIERLCLMRESDPVMRIACGRMHSLVATRSELFTFGDGSCGKLGSGREDDRYTPAPVELPAKAFPLLALSGGPHHSMVVDAAHRLWACGLSGLLEPLMTSDYTESASRAPGSVAMPRMVSKFELADAVLGKVYQVALGSSMALLVLEAEANLPTESSTNPLVKVRPVAPSPAWFERMAQGEDVRVAALSEKLKASEQRCKDLEDQVSSLQALLDQLGPHYRQHPGKALQRVQDLENRLLL